MMRITRFRRTTLQCSQRALTLGLTFIVVSRSILVVSSGGFAAAASPGGRQAERELSGSRRPSEGGRSPPPSYLNLYVMRPRVRS